MNSIRVLLVEDDPVWLRGLSDYLGREKDFCIVGQASSGEEAIQLVHKTDVNVILMDVLLADSLDGIQTTMEINRNCPKKVIMLTSMEEDCVVFDSFRAGVVDYIIKSDFEEIPEAIRAAYHNRSPIRPRIAGKLRQEFCRLKEIEFQIEVSRVRSLLTPAEMSVLELIEKGYTQSEIAKKLFVSIRTVKVHVGNVLRKMGYKCSKEVARKLKEMGII